jgi:hypothetical protein
MLVDPMPIGQTDVVDPVTAQTSANGVALEEDLAQLHDLLGQADIQRARLFVQQLAARWPESDRVRHLARTLAPPVVTTRKGQPGHSRHREREWLRQNAREYAGCWLALVGDQLIAADADLGRV